MFEIKKELRKPLNLILFSIFIILIAATIVLSVLLGADYTNKENNISVKRTKTVLQKTNYQVQEIVPGINDINYFSYKLSNVEPNCATWILLDKQPDMNGIYCVSESNIETMCYEIDANNVAGKGYTMQDFNNLWAGSTSEDFYVVINIKGETVDLTNFYILIGDSSMLYASRAIINCYEAKTVILKDTILTGTLIAPNAKVIYDNSYIYGQVFANKTQGNFTYSKTIEFSGYDSIIDRLTTVEFESDIIRTKVIEELVDNEPETYSSYNRDSILLLSDTVKVTSLNLSAMDIKGLYNDLKYLPNLTYLNLSNCNLSEIDTSKLQNITHLVIAGNKSITSLNLEQLPKLVQLDISNCNLSELDLSKCPNLTLLKCSNTNINSLNIGVAPLLVNVEAYGDKLKEIITGDFYQRQGAILYCNESVNIKNTVA